MSKSSNSRTSPAAIKSIRVGIVGCGNVMDGAYMPQLQRLQQKGHIEIVGASHTSKARCQPILDKWNIPNYFETYQDLCRSNEIDLVLVLTSMKQHAAIAIDALRAGKHVLVEKPIAVSLTEARKVLAVAKKSKGYLVVAPFVTLSPTFQTISTRVAAGDIGKVCLGRARYGWSGPDWSEWFYKKGSGPIFDLAVYCITSLTGILGPAKRVTGMAGTAQLKRTINGKQVRVEVEDSAQVLIDFGDACFAVVTSGFTMQKYRSPALELYGTTGTIQMLGDDWAPEGYELWQNDAGAWQVYSETDPHWQWTSGLNHLVDCVRTDKRPSVTPEHALHVLEIMLAAQKAARTGKAQSIRSSFSVPKRIRSQDVHEAGHRIHDRRRE